MPTFNAGDTVSVKLNQGDVLNVVGTGTAAVSGNGASFESRLQGSKAIGPFLYDVSVVISCVSAGSYSGTTTAADIGDTFSVPSPFVGYIRIAEGKALNVVGTAATGTVQRVDAAGTILQSWTVGSGTLAPIGPFSGTQQLLITCTAGSIDASVGDAVLGGVQLIRSPSSIVTGLKGSDGRAIAAAFNNRPSFISRTVSGAIASSATVQTSTYLTVAASPVPYYALRISVGHLGGNGPITAFNAIVAASDDIGNRDFTDLTAAAFKKCTTPKRGGTEYNTTVTDGSPGWKAVTWNGAATLSIADPGAGKRVVSVSDMIYETGVLDTANNCYPLLVRYYCGSAGLTFVNNLAGVQTGTNAKSDFPDYVFATLSRGATDAVTTPANWSAASTPNASGSASEITIEYFHAGGAVTTVSVVGDSRSGVSAEFSGTKNYKSFERYLGKAFTAAGVPNAITCHGISGAVASAYQTYALADYATPTPANWLVYTVYSINEGAPTAAIMAQCKARAVQMVEKARALGQRVLLVSAFPAGTPGSPSFNAGQLTMLAELASWCQSLADITFNAMSVYGQSDGSWSGLNFDASHMTDAGYQDLAGRIAALINSY